MNKNKLVDKKDKPVNKEDKENGFSILADFYFRPIHHIAKAAIKIENEIYSLDRPARHNNIIQLLADRGILVKGTVRPIMIQGFLDSNGVFLDRTEAFKVAKEAHQIKNGCLIGSILTSEDMW